MRTGVVRHKESNILTQNKMAEDSGFAQLLIAKRAIFKDYCSTSKHTVELAEILPIARLSAAC